MATVALPAFGSDRTISLGLSRRTIRWVTMLVERFSVWHGVEPRVDMWASAGALAIAGIATVALLAVGPF